MNIIVIMLDSLRLDHLGCYGNTWIETPNIDLFAKECVVFENAYPEGLPTIPVRTTLFTGNYTLNNRPWVPLTPHDLTASEILDEFGYVNAFITDTYHFFKPNMNFNRGFHTFRWIRGQEHDAYRSAPHGKRLEDYIKPEMKYSRQLRILDQYLRNTAKRRGEEDYFPPMVFSEATEWLEENYNQHERFFLCVDSFDPHEPWDPPPPFDKKYTDPGYRGPKLIMPKMGAIDWMSEDELKYVRALYAGEVSFVDKWVGVFLKKVEELGLLKNTLIVILSDHGHPLGEHGKILKCADLLYSELIRIPLMIRFPGGQYAGRRIKALVQTVDFLPTVFDIIGIKEETITMQGRSFYPVIKGEKEKIRDYVHVGFYETKYRCVRDLEWSYVEKPEGEKAELYNLKEDPGEKRNLIDENPEKASELKKRLLNSYRINEAKIVSLQLKRELFGRVQSFGILPRF